MTTAQLTGYDQPRVATTAAVAPGLDHVASAPVGRFGLRIGLVALDVITIAFAWLLTVGVNTGATASAVMTTAACVALGLAAMQSQHLYRARVCAVRSVELARTVTASTLCGTAVFVGSRALDAPIAWTEALFGAAVMVMLVAAGRGGFASWLQSRRAAGLHCRPIVIIGTGDEARSLDHLLTDHPEAGFRAVGVVGSTNPGFAGTPWLGSIDEIRPALARAGADSVLVAASDLDIAELNHITREMTRAGVHVHLSNGLQGIARNRLRPAPMAREPLYYLEPAGLSGTQRVVKRVIDVAGALVLLTLAAPVLLVAAIAVKATDRGPVLFRQTRIGWRGRPFTLFKLRTMVPDAEAGLVDLTSANERAGGPLFKLAHDPRRTRVGRILERTSFDEVPQLLNVLRGEMSLVGPRPALPHEVEQFEADFLERHSVVPGITGLWQVEGRDNPSFDVYRRLDLFYVENWSVGLDLVIIAGTVRAVLKRFLPTRSP